MILPWLPEEEIHAVIMRLELFIAELFDSENKWLKHLEHNLIGHSYREIITYRSLVRFNNGFLQVQENRTFLEVGKN